MRTIILAAGQGFNLDGFHKLLLRDPQTGEKIIDQYLHIFAETDITVVLGYKAVEVMQRYPNLHYIYNPDWKLTNNSYSLGLALDSEPCFITSCDLFIDEEVIRRMKDAEPDCILTKRSDSRQPNSLNCSMSQDGRITGIYQGTLHNNTDPEAIGVYKMSDSGLLKEWKKRCLMCSNLFAGQNLPFDISNIYSTDLGECKFHEVNSVMDYMRLLESRKNQK